LSIRDENITAENFRNEFNQNDIRIFFDRQLRQQYNTEQMIIRWWIYFTIVKDLAKRYDISIDDALVWHNNNIFLQPANLDAPISNLQSSVDTRDWQNAVLKTTRITDHLNQFFTKKRFT